MSYGSALLFVDQKTGKVSHTKFWSNVGYAALTFSFIHSTLYGAQIDATVWGLFGGVVVGNRTLLKIFGGAKKEETNAS